MGYNFKNLNTAKTLSKLAKNKEWIERVNSGKYQNGTEDYTALNLCALNDDVEGKNEDEECQEVECEIKRLDNENCIINQNATRKAFNTSQTNYPKDAEVFCINNAFNEYILMSDTPSEVFGKISSDWDAEDRPDATINLDDGFTIKGESTVVASPAPTVEDNLEADDPVTCRFIKSLNKWFFFKPKRGETPQEEKLCHTLVTCEGTALEGFGTHTEMGETFQIWATTLSEYSERVTVQNILAGRETITNCVASDDDECWLPFPTRINTTWRVTHVRGDKYRSEGRIYLKEHFLRAFTPALYDTGMSLNSYSIYRELPPGTSYNIANTVYVYYDGFGKWMRSTCLGLIHSIDENGVATSGVNSIEDLGYVPFSPPYWEEDANNRGLYLPYNGASGTLQFGREQWYIALHNLYIQRSWKKKDYGNQLKKWTYENKEKQTMRLSCNNSYNFLDWFLYENCEPSEEGTGNLILGKLNDAKNGWYEANVNQLQPEQNATFQFRIVTKPDRKTTPKDLLNNVECIGKILKQNNESLYYIVDSNVARWTIDFSTVQNVTFEFVFTLPENSQQEAQPNKIVELYRIVENQWDAQHEKPHKITRREQNVNRNYWILGTYQSPEGWWEYDENNLKTEYTFHHGSVARPDLILEWDGYRGDNGTEDVLYISPEVMTSGTEYN